jgi:hypothetical protein
MHQNLISLVCSFVHSFHCPSLHSKMLTHKTDGPVTQCLKQTFWRLRTGLQESEMHLSNDCKNNNNNNNNNNCFLTGSLAQSKVSHNKLNGSQMAFCFGPPVEHLWEDNCAARTTRAQEEESAHFEFMKFGRNHLQNFFSLWPAVKPRRLWDRPALCWSGSRC